jgi:mannose-6-phosphate isomerase-like protein (cupin superfamily)
MPDVTVRRQSSVSPMRVDSSMELYPLIDGLSSPSVDCVIVALDGTHSRRINRRSHKLYFVLSGSVHISTDESDYTLEANDVAIVPPSVWCKLVGVQANVVIVCTPAFSPRDEEIEPL